MTCDGVVETVLDPTAPEVERRIRELDGRRRTTVTLEAAAGHLVVGGSAREGLVVYADLDDEGYWSAVSPLTGSTAPVRVVAGGQPGDHEARLVVAVDVALAAADAFLASGTLAPEVGWVRS